MRFPTFPAAQGTRSFGVGLDLPWGSDKGIVYEPGVGDRASDALVRYLLAAEFGHLFVSWQPRDRGVLDLASYAEGYDDLVSKIGARYPTRALHHTALNLGALEPYDRSGLLAFTNALIERYAFAWVNEDLGLWSIHGRPLPYPLPPYLTEAGLSAAIANVREVNDALAAPLLVEFPGFSDGTAFVIGKLHAYDFFRRLAEESGAAVTLDIGHLISYQWLRGKRGEALFGDLERLPLEHCFEIHLSGCRIDGDRFFDLHHGVLLDEQFELLRRLLPLCPNARAITYEDPVFDADGVLTAATRSSYDRLSAVAA